MSEQTETKVSKGMPKKVVSILIILLFISGAGVAAFMFIGGASDKASYFKAEVDTFEYIKEKVTDRFEHELDWLEYTENNPIESTVDVSVQFNDPGFFGYGMVDIEELVNNSKISIVGQSDIKNKQLTTDLNANIAGLDFSDFRFGLTEESLLVDLPFLNDVLRIDGKDTGPFLHMLDPYTFDEDTEIDFGMFFDTNYSSLAEDDMDYLKKEYGELIYKEIKEDAFTSEKDSVEIDGETIKAEKIELVLEDEDLKDILKQIIVKMQSDDRLKDILKDQLEMSFASKSETEEILNEFDEGLEIALEDLEDSDVEVGVTSTIWIDKGLIVKRSLVFDSIDESGVEIALRVEGTQLLDKETQTFNYDLVLDEDNNEETANITGKLTESDGKYKDSLSLQVDEVVISYEGDETKSGDNTDFTRTINFNDGWSEVALVWSGDATYEKDQMNGNHQIYVEGEGFGQDLLTLHLDVTGNKIKSVDMLNEQDTLNIGEMSEAELADYLENDAGEQFMEWYFEVFGAMGELLY